MTGNGLVRSPSDNEALQRFWKRSARKRGALDCEQHYGPGARLTGMGIEQRTVYKRR
ncbi:hypothetical protein GCM10028794_11450 [Silanimonas algicola]